MPVHSLNRPYPSMPPKVFRIRSSTSKVPIENRPCAHSSKALNPKARRTSPLQERLRLGDKNATNRPNGRNRAILPKKFTSVANVR
ncbi:hypothetical protein D3C81_2052220 [compost metagenome]